MFFMSTMERRGASLGTIPVLAPSPRTPECPQTQPPFPLPSTRSPALSSFPPHPGPQVSSLPQQAGTLRNRPVSKQDSLHSKMAIAWTCPHRDRWLSQKRLLHVLLLRSRVCVTSWHVAWLGERRESCPLSFSGRNEVSPCDYREAPTGHPPSCPWCPVQRTGLHGSLAAWVTMPTASLSVAILSAAQPLLWPVLSPTLGPA